MVGALHPDYAGDPFHYILMQILMAARARGGQALGGPFLPVRGVEGFRQAPQRAAVLVVLGLALLLTVLTLSAPV